VSFYKPQGDLNTHAGLIRMREISTSKPPISISPRSCRRSRTAPTVIIAFDGNGGWWDHVAPPKGDRWGPGTRIPTIIVSSYARRGEVDHNVYDTGSSCGFSVGGSGYQSYRG
jgi:phospholipase C